jgi:hypothetical protein
VPRAETRSPTPRRATDPDHGCEALLQLMTGADEGRRVTTLDVVVDPLEGRHKRMLARLLVDSLRRAAPSRRSPAVASLAAIGPDAADAIGRGVCSSTRRAFVVDMMRAAALLAPRLEGTDRLDLEMCLYLGVRKSRDPEVRLAYEGAVAAFQASCMPGPAASNASAD